MDLEQELKELKTLQDSADSAKEKLLCQVDKVVKEHTADLPYRIDFNGSLLLIRFKTRRLEPSIPYHINKDLGMEGALVPKQGYYGIQLVYMSEEEL